MIATDIAPVVSDLLGDFLGYVERKANKTEKDAARPAPKIVKPKPDRNKVFGVRQEKKARKSRKLEAHQRKRLPRTVLPCQRPGCNGMYSVTSSRSTRKFCSLECARIASKERLVLRNKSVMQVQKPLELTCMDCKQTRTVQYVSGGKPVRCTECLRKHKRGVSKAYNDARAAERRAARVASQAKPELVSATE